MRPVLAMFLALIALLALSLPAFAQDGEIVRFYVGPDTAECEGVAPQQCLLISTEPDGEVGYFYDHIEGFEHQPGTAYVIDVLVEPVANPPADGSSLRYTLVKIVEETTGSLGPAAFAIIPDETFCRSITEDVDGCVAVLRSTASEGLLPQAFAEVLEPAD